MEAMQRQVLKLFRRDKTPHGSKLTESRSENNLDLASLGKVKLRLNSRPDQDGEESDSAKYWSSAKTHRKLKHLCSKRALPPLPPGAKSRRTPDIFPHHNSSIHLGRGVDSPAHIYEEIPSWAIDGDTKIHNDQEFIGSSEALISPTKDTHTNTQTPFDNRGFLHCGENGTQNHSVFHIVKNHNHHQQPSPKHHQQPQKPKLHPKSYNKLKHTSYSEIPHSSNCSSTPIRQHCDLLDLKALNAKSESCLVNQTQTTQHWNTGKASRHKKGLSFNVKLSDPPHQVSSTPGHNHLNGLDSVRVNNVLEDDLDKLDIPVQDTDYFVKHLKSTKDNLHGTDDPLQVFEAKGKHNHDDSIDEGFEYDINGSTSSGVSHTRSRSDTSTSSGQKDPSRSFDKDSFRSHGKSESSSNDTFSEYDIKSDASTCDMEGDYDCMLSKIRDNLKLKEDVQKLVNGSQKSDSSHTLTAVSSLSEISTLGEDEVKRLMATANRPASQYSLGASSDEGKLNDLPAKLTKSAGTSGAQCHLQHGVFNSSFDISYRKSQPNEMLHKRTQSVSCLKFDEGKKDEGKLSCRVSTLRPEAVQRRSSRTLSKPNVRVSNTPKKPYVGSNKLLADIMQKNYDRHTLFL